MVSYHTGHLSISITIKRVITSKAFALLVVIGIISSCRSPERIIRSVCDVDLTDVKYKINRFDEKWLLNGDGHCYIELAITDSTSFYRLLSTMMNRGAIPVNSDLTQNTFHWYPKHNEGLFVIWQNGVQSIIEKDSDNSVLLMLDTEKRLLVYESYVW